MGSDEAEPGTVLWSEAYDEQWTADGDGERLEHVKPFGWSNGYELGSEGTVAVHYGGQPVRYGLMAVSLALWAATVTVLVRGRKRRRRPRAPKAPDDDVAAGPDEELYERVRRTRVV
ncbi:MAG: hypothetical protein ACRDWD_08110 [Acidimicrobiia bacterium]